jgi:hypothetical protein
MIGFRHHIIGQLIQIIQREALDRRLAGSRNDTQPIRKVIVGEGVLRNQFAFQIV